MSRIIWFPALLSLLSLDPAPLSAADCHPCQGWSQNPPPKPREGAMNNVYGGVVTEVTKDSITIQWVNSFGEKAKTFAVSETLAAGKVPIERRVPAGQKIPPNPMMPEYMYRLTDVMVGDCVGIFYARINGVDICDHIRICRRPDGEVPPLPKEAEDLRRSKTKTLQELFKGKDPAWVAKLPKNNYVPYHEWVNAYWAKIAPMPREVKVPKTPNAKP